MKICLLERCQENGQKRKELLVDFGLCAVYNFAISLDVEKPFYDVES